MACIVCDGAPVGMCKLHSRSYDRRVENDGTMASMLQWAVTERDKAIHRAIAPALKNLEAMLRRERDFNYSDVGVALKTIDQATRVVRTRSKKK